jgi:nucleotide-binding universal stress UspA family protein
MFHHILFPVDDFAVQKADFSKLKDLTQKVGAKITLLHVSDPLPPAFYMQNGYGGDYITVPEHKKACESYAGRMFKKVTEQIGNSASIDTAHIYNTDVTQGILDAAVSTKADVIMMVSHRRSGLRELFSGSETEDVIAKAKLPVLVL